MDAVAVAVDYACNLTLGFYISQQQCAERDREDCLDSLFELPVKIQSYGWLRLPIKRSGVVFQINIARPRKIEETHPDACYSDFYPHLT